MIAVLTDVVRNIVVLIILVTILELVLPRSSFRPFVNMVVGLVLMLMLLSPLRSVLQFPGALDPVLEMRLSVTESDIAARHALLEQMNWDLTLVHYRDLIADKVEEIVGQEGFVVSELALTLEEDVNHLQFGQPQSIVVSVKKAPEAERRFGQVEPIEIDIGNRTEAPLEPSRDGALERKVAEVLGVSQEKVEVYVL